MECERVRDELVKFVDDEQTLQPDEMRKPMELSLQAHLDVCAECSKELESIRNVLEFCHNWKDISPSRDWGMELKRKMAKSQREPMTELEILRSAVIGLSRRVQKLEDLQSVLPPTLEGEIMTVDELARYLRLSTEQVYEIIDQLPRFQIGYEYRFRKSSIDQWIRSLEHHPYSQGYLWGNWYTREE